MVVSNAEWSSWPREYAEPEILVIGSVKVEYGASAWNFASGNSYSRWEITEGSDPAATTIALAYIPEPETYAIQPRDLGGHEYSGEAEVSIQRLEGSVWVNEFTTKLTSFYGDRPWKDTRTWSKYYSTTTRIRPYIRLISTDYSVRQRRIDMYIYREGPSIV